MNDLEKVLKGVVYGSVGAVASAIEAGSGLAKTFVEKGQEAVRQGQEKAKELEQTIRENCARVPEFDLSLLSRAQRDELRRKLDELDAQEDAAAAEAERAPVMDMPPEEEPAEPEEAPVPEVPVEIPVMDPLQDDTTYTE